MICVLARAHGGGRTGKPCGTSDATRRGNDMNMQSERPGEPSTLGTYWALDTDVAFTALHASVAGLSSAEAERRLRQYGPNEVHEQHDLSRWSVLLNQLRNPLLWLLLFAAGASCFAGEWADAS